MLNMLNKLRHNWHKILNEFNTRDGNSFEHWMYEAKNIHSELPRLKLLFEAERKNELTKLQKQCSLSEPEEVKDNHLTCCIGVECKKCEYLLALDEIEAEPELIDEVKAYTCVTHILNVSATKTIDTSEGYILSEDDKMFWGNVCGSLANGAAE